MKKTIAFMSISLLLSLPALANDLAKPPVFEPSAETIDRIEQQKIQQQMADKADQQKDQDALSSDQNDSEEDSGWSWWPF